MKIEKFISWNIWQKDWQDYRIRKIIRIFLGIMIGDRKYLYKISRFTLNIYIDHASSISFKSVAGANQIVFFFSIMVQIQKKKYFILI